MEPLAPGAVPSGVLLAVDPASTDAARPRLLRPVLAIANDDLAAEDATAHEGGV